MDDIIINVGKNIKNLREQSGITQSSIAKYLKVDQSLISKIEKGERVITSDMLDKLSALFGIKTSDFYKDSVSTSKILFSFRASDINEDDLEAMSAINRIVLNLNFMTKLSGGDKSDR